MQMTVGANAPDTPESWSAASQGYAEKVAPLLMEPFAEAIVSRLELSGVESAIEVGAGSGALTQLLSERVASLVATDFSPAMIDLLRDRMASAGHVRCEVMDGQSLTLDDASVDVAASSFALMLFPSRSNGFSELNRVVRPGGRVAVSAWAGPDRFEAFALFLAALNRAFPDLPPPPSPPPVLSLANPSIFAEEMEAVGFVGVEVEV
jgi:SAM-dependent methyltransferase